MVAKTLWYTGWASIPSIMSMPYGELRNSLISSLHDKCNQPLVSLQKMNDPDLCWAAMMYKFLFDAGIFTAEQLLTMTLDDERNAVIELNTTLTGLPASGFQAKNNARNLIVAYEQWFHQNSSTRQKIDKLNGVTSGSPTFNLKDDKNFVMDVLRIVKADEVYTYLGVYHAMANTNQFKLYLAGSNDLKTWTNLTELGDRAHQGDIKKWGNGYLVTNEQDPVQGTNNIRIRYYSSYAGLVANTPSNDKSIPQTFSNLAEGTPDIRIIEGNAPSSSHILIGYHYYENGIHDQQAFGILRNFNEWRTWKDEPANFTTREMGYRGNIGGRSAFFHSGNFVLQEAQITPGDWSSWRLLFGNGVFYYTLHPETALGSTSFANPGIVEIEPGRFAVTSFLPSQGNHSRENGELLYTIRF